MYTRSNTCTTYHVPMAIGTSCSYTSYTTAVRLSEASERNEARRPRRRVVCHKHSPLTFVPLETACFGQPAGRKGPIALCHRYPFSVLPQGPHHRILPVVWQRPCQPQQQARWYAVHARHHIPRQRTRAAQRMKHRRLHSPGACRTRAR